MESKICTQNRSSSSMDYMASYPRRWYSSGVLAACKRDHGSSEIIERGPLSLLLQWNWEIHFELFQFVSYTIIKVSCNVNVVSSCFFGDFWRNIELTSINHLWDRFNMDCDSKNKIAEFYHKYSFASYHVTYLTHSQVGSQHLTLLMSTQRTGTLHSQRIYNHRLADTH
jgi:hypothetical protein